MPADGFEIAKKHAREGTGSTVFYNEIPLRVCVCGRKKRSDKEFCGLCQWRAKDMETRLEKQRPDHDEEIPLGTLMLGAGNEKVQAWFKKQCLVEAADIVSDQARLRMIARTIVSEGVWPCEEGEEPQPANEASRRFAMKLLSSDVSEKMIEKVVEVDGTEHRTLRINLHLDAVRRDPRVSEQDIEEMFDPPVIEGEFTSKEEESDDGE